jgi:hypothetical protein
VHLLQTALLDALCRYRSIIFIYNTSGELINFLADRISWNAMGLYVRDTTKLFKPKELMVATINLDTDNSKSKGLNYVPSSRRKNPRNNPNYGAEKKDVSKMV